MVVDMASIKRLNKNQAIAKTKEITEETQSDPEVEEVPQEIRVIAQEVRIVQNLANNDLVIRTRQMKKLKNWLKLRAQSSFPFKEDDFMRIWKGMYYHFWLSDKPLVQEELAQDMSKLVDCFEGNIELSVNFFGAFMKTMCQQWFGMDQWRMDKYMMLVRRMLRALFLVLKESSWDKEAIDKFNTHMLETILDAESNALGLVMHYFDIFFEELAKIADGDIDDEEVAEFVKPFIKFLSYQTDYKLLEHCKKKVFYHLLYQSSLGREYQDKYNAWKEMGFPTRSINDLEKADESIEEDVQMNGDDDADGVEDNKDSKEEVKHLDPRAGNVDVFIAELPLNGKLIIKELETLLSKYDLTTKRRKMLRKLLEMFQKYEAGDFPLGVKNMPRFEATPDQPLIESKVEELENLENELYGTERKLKKLNKRKRRRLLKSLNYDEANEENFDEIIDKALPKNLQKRKEIQRSLMHGWTEEELDESELPFKKSKQNDTNNKKQKKQNQNLSQIETKNQLKLQNGLNEDVKKKQKSLSNGISKQTPLKDKSKKNQKDIIEESKKAGNVAESLVNDLKDGKEKMPAAVEETNKILKINTEENTINKTPQILQKKYPKVLKISTDDEDLTPKKVKKSNNVSQSEWDTPLAEGEVEYFIPSNKLRLKQANTNLNSSNASTPIRQMKSTSSNTPGSSAKRVKIVLKHNTSQNPSEYIKQVRSSPNVPYDASKKPSKGLLKPNVTPGPINPFYKKKIGLKLFNDTF